jgi:multidrug efflux system membrane fusion protein
VKLQLDPVEAVRVPRSALTFSAEGELSLRSVDTEGVVASVPVTIVEDSQQELWVAGVPAGARIIVQGQDFVKDGQRVEAVAAAGAALLSRS